jgi:hypothetical protein
MQEKTRLETGEQNRICRRPAGFSASSHPVEISSSIPLHANQIASKSLLKGLYWQKGILNLHDLGCGDTGGFLIKHRDSA